MVPLRSASPAERLAAVTQYRHQCEDFFGVYRREALEGSDLHGLYSGSDRVLLAEIALRGKIVLVDEPLFLHREHNQRYTRAVLLTNRKKATNWQDTSGKTKVVTAKLFHITVYKNLWRVVEKNIHDPKDKRACEIEVTVPRPRVHPVGNDDLVAFVPCRRIQRRLNRRLRTVESIPRRR